MTKQLFPCLLCATLLLTGCGSGERRTPPEAEIPAVSQPAATASEKITDDKPEEAPALAQGGTVYIPDHYLTPQETVAEFFRLQYDIYTNMRYVDISTLVDSGESRNRNALVWLQALTMRRRLIAENDLCYVETRQFPYTITFEQTPEDGRMEFWRNRGLDDDNQMVLHFTITGEKGNAYPPLMAMNAQHTMRLQQVDGMWKITFHYFPGSVRRFRSGNLELPDEEQLLADLQEEFARVSTDKPPAAAKGAYVFDGARAAAYAEAYTEKTNPVFYDIGDWMGNCANFISQCVWFGFGSGDLAKISLGAPMTDDWFGGSGGGSPAWENVGYFWDYAIEKKGSASTGMHGTAVDGIRALELGGVIQVRTGRFRQTDDSFNHSLILTDTQTLKLAQNSPDCFVYYSDLVNVDSRFYNPAYFID